MARQRGAKYQQVADCLSALSCFFSATPPDGSDIGSERGPQSGLVPVINSSGELRAWSFKPTLDTVKRLIGNGTEDSIVRRLLRRLEREPFRVRRKKKEKVIGTLPSAFPRGYLRLDSRRGRRPTRKN